MILDTLSGTSPLSRVEQFFLDKDAAQLLREEISRAKLNDQTMGRVLDRISSGGAERVLGAVVVRVMGSFELDLSHIHQNPAS